MQKFSLVSKRMAFPDQVYFPSGVVIFSFGISLQQPHPASGHSPRAPGSPHCPSGRPLQRTSRAPTALRSPPALQLTYFVWILVTSRFRPGSPTPTTITAWTQSAAESPSSGRPGCKVLCPSGGGPSMAFSSLSAAAGGWGPEPPGLRKTDWSIACFVHRKGGNSNEAKLT